MRKYPVSVRLAEGVHIQWIGDEAVVLDEDSGQLHYLNSTAAVILAMLLEHGEEKTAGMLAEAYEGAHPNEEDLTEVLADLREKGVVEGP